MKHKYWCYYPHRSRYSVFFGVRMGISSKHKLDNLLLQCPLIGSWYQILDCTLYAVELAGSKSSPYDWVTVRVNFIVSPTHSPAALIRSQQAAPSPGVTWLKGSNSNVSKRSRLTYHPTWPLVGRIVLNTVQHCTASHMTVWLWEWTLLWDPLPVLPSISVANILSPIQRSLVKIINCTISRRARITYHLNGLVTH